MHVIALRMSDCASIPIARLAPPLRAPWEANARAHLEAEFTKMRDAARSYRLLGAPRGAAELVPSRPGDDDKLARSSVEWLLYGEIEPKRLALFDGGHFASLEIAAPIVNGWLDETLGPVKH